jgi:hypothetical protein
MKNDVRGTCLALIKSGTAGSRAGARPRPAAVGWKLQSGMVPAAELNALCRSVFGEFAGVGPGPRRWVASEPLRALLAEYHAVRRGAARSRDAEQRVRGRRVARPADCA